MTREEAIKRIDDMRIELDMIRSVLAVPKKRKRIKRDFTKQINKSLMKTPHQFITK